MIDQNGLSDALGSFHVVALGNHLYRIEIMLADATRQEFNHWIIATTGLGLRRLPKLQLRYVKGDIDLAPSVSASYRMIEEQLFSRFVADNPTVLAELERLDNIGSSHDCELDGQ